MKNFQYHLPKEGKALGAAAAAGAHPKAGGTDLVPLMKLGIVEPESVVSLMDVPELRGIAKREDRFHIGATTTLAELADHKEIAKAATALSETARLTATPIIRHRATVGGNLAQRPRCWYFRHPDYPCSKKGGDTCFAAEGENKYHAIFENVTCNIVHPSNLAPALWALDATLELRKGKDESRVGLDAFWVLPEEDLSQETVLEEGQLITAVQLPLPKGNSGSAYIEVREKQSYDWAMVNAATRVDLKGNVVEDLRIIVSAVAPVPLRREAAEAVLRGKAFDEKLAWKAAKAACADATPLRDNKYKVRMLEACVAHALIQAAERARS